MFIQQVKQETWLKRLLRTSAFLCVLMSFGINDFAVAAMLHCDCDLVDNKSNDEQTISCHEDPQSLGKDGAISRYVETGTDENDLVKCDKCVRHCQLSGQASIVSVGIAVEYFFKDMLRFVDPIFPQSILPLGIEYPPKIKL